MHPECDQGTPETNFGCIWALHWTWPVYLIMFWPVVETCGVLDVTWDWLTLRTMVWTGWQETHQNSLVDSLSDKYHCRIITHVHKKI